MVTVDSYPLAIALCVVTMLCWGSWANTQKLVRGEWPFQLYYWDYSIGVLLFAIVFALTLGSAGDHGRSFIADLRQADSRWLLSAFCGGVLFNLSNILLVAAIDIAGMAVAFPVGVGLALALGVVTTYIATRAGNAPMLAVGVMCVLIAIVLDAVAYRRLPFQSERRGGRGLGLAIGAGVLMGWFYSFVARAMGVIDPHSHAIEPHKLTPYTALVCFAVGLFASSFIWNSIAMARPFRGPRVSYKEYFHRGDLRVHAVGVLGGVIWNTGMGLSILAGAQAGPALSYGLGQGATMVGAIWGVFVWKEFKSAPAGTSALLAAMFLFYALGLAVLVASKL